MRVWLWAGPGVLLALLAGCGGEAPSDPADPPPKTETIKNRDGATETQTTDPAAGDAK